MSAYGPALSYFLLFDPNPHLLRRGLSALRELVVLYLAAWRESLHILVVLLIKSLDKVVHLVGSCPTDRGRHFFMLKNSLCLVASVR
jgi:hypothetical protein